MSCTLGLYLFMYLIGSCFAECMPDHSFALLFFAVVLSPTLHCYSSVAPLKMASTTFLELLE